MLKKISYGGIVALALLLLFTFGSSFYRQLYSQASRYTGKEIVKIDFNGNHFVKDEVMFQNISLKVGDVLEAKKLNESIKQLFQTGSFQKVWAEAAERTDGIALRFQVIENPFVNRIKIKGNLDLGESEIRSAIPLKEKEVYSETKQSESIEILLRQYREKGLMNAFVKIRAGQLNKVTNTLDIQIRIDEGERIKISKINIIGVEKLNPAKILSKLSQKENALFRDGNFQENKFEQDKESIIAYYKEHGYMDVVMEQADWEIRWKNPQKKEKRVIVITYKVKEGEQSFFAGYRLDWDENFLNSETQKPLYTKKKMFSYFEYTNNMTGKVFNNTVYNRDVGIINYLYSKEGYIFARVVPEQTVILLTKEDIDKFANSAIQKEHEKKKIDYYNIEYLRKVYEKTPELHGRKFIHTKLTIAEGNKGYLENIIIKGNTKTKDKVIRREVLMKEGELFNAELIQRSREKIYNLGYFKSVNIDARPGSSENQMNLIIEVEEQPTGNISLGGGYGTLSGFSIFAELSENNLKGTGQKISGKVEFGAKRLVLGGSWTQPWLANRPWSLTLSASYSHVQEYSTSIGIANTGETAYYYQDSIGFSIGVGHSFGRNWGHYHGITPLFSKASNPSSMVSDEIYQLVQYGWKFKHTLTNSIYFDNRDNTFNTTKGLYFNFSINLVGSIMGGTSHYIRYNPVIDFFWWPMDFTFFNAIRNNMLRRWRIVFEHRISAYFTQMTGPVYGKQDTSAAPYVEESDRLLLGGYETLRGWDKYDSKYPLAWQDGGSHRIMFSNELRIPLEPNLVWFVLFFDIGALFDNPKEYHQLDTLASDLVESINDSQLTAKNLFGGSYYRYSWGFGLRVQIPILPIRLFMGQRLVWNAEKKRLTPPEGAKEFNFVFGIGDKRF